MLTPGHTVEIIGGAGQCVTLNELHPELLASLDGNVRIVRGLDDCAPGLPVVQVVVRTGPEDFPGTLRHGQTTADYLEMLCCTALLNAERITVLPFVPHPN